MKKRLLGTTGRALSMVGSGGIVVMNESIASARRLVAKAVDRGINYKVLSLSSPKNSVMNRVSST